MSFRSTYLRAILIGFLAIAALTSCRSDLNSHEVQSTLATPTPDFIITEMPNDGAVSPPVVIDKVKRALGKPPLQAYQFDLEISPRRDGFRWLLFADPLDRSLPANGVFVNDCRFDPPIEGDRHEGPVVVLSGYGSRGFRALRPAGGTVKLRRFRLDSWSDRSYVEVWEVESLLVNGETPLEDWLPFDSTSSPTSKPVDDSDWERKTSLRFETNVLANRTGTYVPKGKVDFIRAVGVRRWILSFNFTETDRF